MKSLRAGDLNKRVLLRKTVTIRDESGGTKQTVVDVATVWASAEAISNRKIRSLDQGQIVETMMFVMRPRTDVLVDWQAVLNGQVYTIRAADRTHSDRLQLTGEADTRHDRI
ncbi:phage head closure protein [Ewingella allii]|uniref:phage head closure protein n=1 Tax=Ewingella allii TaxID=3092550 RepID=UPI0037B22712